MTESTVTSKGVILVNYELGRRSRNRKPIKHSDGWQGF